MDNYQILIVGASGRGKTYAARNLDKEKVAFINAEKKPLPFPGKFKHTYLPNNLVEVKRALVDVKSNQEVNYVFLDSWSAVLDMLLAEARATKKGFETWNFYNEEVGKLLDFIKKLGKDIILTSHYEILGIEGSQEKRSKIKGETLPL